MKKVIMIILSIALCTTSAFASEASEPIYSIDFYSSESFQVTDSVYGIELYDLFKDNIDPSKEYYFKIDDLIFKSSFVSFSLEDTDFILAGDHSFLYTMTLSSVCPFFLLLKPSSDSFSEFYYSLDYCSSDVHSHSFAIYDRNPPSGDTSKDFMSNLNDGTLEDAGSILDGSLDNLPDLSQHSDFTSFLSAALAWVPSEYWTIYALCFVLLIVRVVIAFLWR